MPTQFRKELLITDLVERTADGNLSPKTNRNCWRIVDYELEKIGAGRGLAIGEWKPGRVTIRLGLEGWHRIGLISRYSQIQAKLTSDRCFDLCRPVSEGNRRLGQDHLYREGYYDAEEVVWRDADLTDQDLILDDQSGTTLLAIRLTPIEPPTPDKSAVRWPMMFTLDGGEMGMKLHERPDDLFERAERIGPNTCVRVVIYGGIAGDICGHHTRVGSEFGSVRDKGDEWSEDHRITCENLERWRQWNKNPAKAMVEYGHQRGWELYFYQRLGWDGYVPYNGCKASRFFLDHPEYHTVGPKGEKVMGLSVAHPEVVEHMAAFYAELASFGANGVSPCFIRGCPMVLYEPIMVEGFKKKYGKDPRQLPESDSDWQDYCAEMVTSFMRRAKEALGTCRLSPIIHGRQTLNRRFALDIATWVREGIVDDLFIMADQYDRHDGHYAGGPEHLEFEYFNSLPGRENVRLWPMFYLYGTNEAYRDLGYNFTHDRFCDALQNYLDQGADGYGFWDAVAHNSETDIFHLGKMPRHSYQKNPNRLVGKYELIYWDGWLWNRWSPVESS